MILTIAARELRSLFLSPLAWAVLAIVQVVLAFLFLSHIEQYIELQPQLLANPKAPGVSTVVVARLFGSSAIVLLLVVPLLTMRAIAGERRSRTLALLLSAPASMTQIIVGKYLGITAFLGVLLALITLMPLSLLTITSIDLGMLAASVLGLALLLAGFAAVGLFMSTLTEHAALAAVGSFGMLLLLWLLDWSGTGGGGLAYLSLLNHYEPFLRGVFDSADAAFHALFVLSFLALSVRRLDAERLGG